MNLHIRPMSGDDSDIVVHLSLAAWAPVFSSFEGILGPHIYSALYPDWQRQQQEVVEGVCRDVHKFIP